MATLYVENVPDELYAGLRARARAHRNSISSEVLQLLEENIPTESELERRRELLKVASKLRSKGTRSRGAHLTAEEMQRQDRAR